MDAATRQVLDTYRYAPFDSLLAGGTSNNTRRFTGETQDPTGLYYLRAHYYDPATGRFLTRDPFPGLAILPTTQHPYVYVGNNPVNLVDPGGEIAPILVAVGISAAIGGVGGGVGYVLAHPGGRPEDYLRSSGFRQAVGIGFASGAVAGAVGWLVPTLLPASGFWGSVGVGALSGSLASGAGQVTANLLNPCVPWYHNLGWALATGGVTGGIAGGVGYGIRQWRPSTAARLQDAATQADQAIPGRGAVVGTQRHTMFREVVNNWSDPHLRTEVSFFGRGEVRYGTAGLVRLDVVGYDAALNIIAVYDYKKTGNATLTAARIAQIRAHLPWYAQNVPIIVIRGR